MGQSRFPEVHLIVDHARKKGFSLGIDDRIRRFVPQVGSNSVNASIADVHVATADFTLIDDHGVDN